DLLHDDPFSGSLRRESRLRNHDGNGLGRARAGMAGLLSLPQAAENPAHQLAAEGGADGAHHRLDRRLGDALALAAAPAAARGGAARGRLAAVAVEIG